MQSVEGLSKILTSKQGDVTFMFYNSGKTFLWYEVGTKAKVCTHVNLLYTTTNDHTTGTTYTNQFFRISDLS